MIRPVRRTGSPRSSSSTAASDGEAPAAPPSRRRGYWLGLGVARRLLASRRGPAPGQARARSQRPPSRRRPGPHRSGRRGGSRSSAPTPSSRRRRAGLGAGRRQRRQHGEPDRAADLDRRVDQPGGEAGVAPAWRPTSPASSATGSRAPRPRRTGPSPAARRSRSCRRPASARTEQPGGDQAQPGQQRRPGAEAHVEPGREAERERPISTVTGRKARPTSSAS